MRYVTSDLPGIGGAWKVVPEDFVVDEIPAYLPSGEGTHTYLWVEKRGLNTDDAVTRLCAALGVRPQDAGVAGQKDRHALTRQWISLPGVDPARAEGLTVDGARVLAVSRHGNKLRTGHLRGNRFVIVVRGVVAGAEPLARAILDRLVAVGLPNYFGAQRFGARGDNAARGKAVVFGTTGVGRAPARGERRLLVSAYQSELFNRYLDRRIDDGLLGEILVGDVVQRSDTGGVFWVAAGEHADAVARAARGELVPTGPMFGHKMMTPPADTPAAAREQALIDEEGLAPVLARSQRDFDGARRALVVRPAQVTLEAAGDDALAVGFALPPGAYATQLLAELTRAK